MSKLWVLSFVLVALPMLAQSCRVPREQADARLDRHRNEIVACGQRFHVGAPVVLWNDPGGYDAYQPTCRFVRDRILPSAPAPGCGTPERYDPIRNGLPEAVAHQVATAGWNLALLRQVVDQFVIHYDAAGTSRRCFEVLHDERGLSVHFLLDLDGTVYQTLDLKERARHAGPANDHSIGIEIANIGAYRSVDPLKAWYSSDESGGVRITVPADHRSAGVYRDGFVPRPARPRPVQGIIQGQQLYQYDLTDAQYESLIHLTDALCRIFPRLRPEVPRDADGRVRRTVCSPDSLASFEGVLGHWHVSAQKVDPGPAFDWKRLLEGVDRLEREDESGAELAARATPAQGDQPSRQPALPPDRTAGN